MTRRLADDIDNASVALPAHDRQHGMDHGKEAEHFVAQLPLKNIERRAVDRAAQVCSGIVDQNIDATEGCLRSSYEILHSRLVGNVGRHAEDGISDRTVAVCLSAVPGKIGDGGIEASAVPRANRDATALIEQ